MRYKQATIQGLCKDTERFYNAQVSELSEASSDQSDARLERYKALYESALIELRGFGIGGVLINGIFRDISRG